MALTDQATPHNPPAAAGQSFGTAGIEAMARPSALTRIFMRIVEGVERLNQRCAKFGNPCVYDNATFPWAMEIEREWRTIRGELDRILLRKDDLPGFQEIATDVATISQDRDWKTFFLVGFGVRSERNISECPQTWRIVQKIPGLKTAMFSIFEPGKHLPPHRGPYNGVLRLHLGLIVPEPRQDVAIRIGSEVCHWDEGRALIFDDAYNHEAWNHTPHVRVVLFVDFVKPLRFPANFVNWLLIHIAVFTPFIRESQNNQRNWEQRFYAEAAAWRNR